MGAGIVLTVTLAVVKQPDDNVYVTLHVPVPTPFTMPVLLPTVAIVGQVIVHVPDGAVLPSVVVLP
jgi:hypothetical protein